MTSTITANKNYYPWRVQVMQDIYGAEVVEPRTNLRAFPVDSYFVSFLPCLNPFRLAGADVVRPGAKMQASYRDWLNPLMDSSRVSISRVGNLCKVVHSMNWMTGCHDLGPPFGAYQTLKKPALFVQLRDRIRGFTQLQPGWDSYHAEAPSLLATQAALNLVEELEKYEITPDWVVPTSDASILMQFHHNGCRYKWEFDSDGDIAVSVKSLFDQPKYFDIAPEDMAEFFDKQMHGAARSRMCS